MLYRAGLDFFEIAQDDPHLPLKLLPPDWPGIEAAMAFQKWRQKLLPEANQFIDRVLSET